MPIWHMNHYYTYLLNPLFYKANHHTTMNHICIVSHCNYSRRALIEIVNQVHQNELFKISLLKGSATESEIKPTHILIFDSCPLDIIKSVDSLMCKIKGNELKRAKVIVISDEKFKMSLACSFAMKLKHFYHVSNCSALSESINLLSLIIHYDIYPRLYCKNAVELLSKNEHRVIYGYLIGESVLDLASELSISEKTVYSHKRNALLKLGFIMHGTLHHKILLSIFDIR